MNDRQRLGSLDDFIQQVEETLDKYGGVHTFQMSDLKRLAGIGRLGKRVREELQRALDRAELGCYPRPLPSSENHSVRLYRLGTKLERLILAATTVDEENDERLLRFASGAAADPSQERLVLDKIRRILDRLE